MPTTMPAKRLGKYHVHGPTLEMLIHTMDSGLEHSMHVTGSPNDTVHPVKKKRRTRAGYWVSASEALLILTDQTNISNDSAGSDQKSRTICGSECRDVASIHLRIEGTPLFRYFIYN
ncbi:unnamed protein product [Protopolystoma xenopodis]|uniref:Uncharacterized protein n=1 Tax=Protopolystoma xenopodis TaxID=117903 RepID=A0A3S5BTM7_9PLAT|nr:unnamed protein product [Protopolystoma xenopodis]